jgi:hypothetical protein
MDDTNEDRVYVLLSIVLFLYLLLGFVRKLI